ncbi:MAG: formylmethanofuran dehydrogenase subunit B [Pirellulales bacterium]
MPATPPRPAENPAGLKIVADATCAGCGCACDDIELSVQGDQIVAATRACALGEAWFFEQPSADRPSCTLAGRPATVAEGVERAAQILAAARYPLVYGLVDTTCEAQRVAASIADWIGGTIDTPTSSKHGPGGVSFQGVGEVTCSLGEMANRGDMIIVWGADPVVSQPRHFERYSLQPQGMFVPGGRRDRTLVVIDVERTASAAAADIFLQIKRGQDFEALWTLRALAQGLPLDAGVVEHQTGVPLATWQDLMQRMMQARFGVFLFGQGLTMTSGRYLNAEALVALVRDMNAHTRFAAQPLRAGGNGAGADSVLLWRTGYPFGVNLSRGYPRFNPGEYTAQEVLARGEADAALLVGGDPLAEFAGPARAALETIPLVAIASRDTATARAAAVAFTTARYGIHTAGTVYRMDDVPLPLRPALHSPHPSDVAVLAAIEARVRKLKAIGCGL